MVGNNLKVVPGPDQELSEKRLHEKTIDEIIDRKNVEVTKRTPPHFPIAIAENKKPGFLANVFKKLKKDEWS